MLKNEYLFANCFFRTLCRNLPENWLDLSFFYNQEKRFVFREYSGNFPELPAHNWKLFFRDTFVVNEPMAIAFKLTTNVIPCRLTVVDNDTGTVKNFFTLVTREQCSKDSGIIFMYCNVDTSFF